MLATETATIETTAPVACTLVADDAPVGLNDHPWTFERTVEHQLHTELMAWRVAGEQAPSTNWVRLLEWERNGPNDSDWYSVVMHRPSGHMFTVESGTTRFANALHVFTGFFAPLTDADLVAARKTWAEMSARYLCAVDKRECEEPQPHVFKQVGVEVTLLRKANVEVRATEPCRKCNGSGRYTGRREGACFACDGLGFKLAKKPSKGSDTPAKPAKIKIEAGARATTLAPSEAWGTFYKGGYNRPDRNNSRALCKLESGEVVFLSLDALRLTREPITFESKLEDTTRWAANLSQRDERWAAPFGVRVF